MQESSSEEESSDEDEETDKKSKKQTEVYEYIYKTRFLILNIICGLEIHVA